MDAAPKGALLVAVADTAVERGDAGHAAAPERLELGGDLRAELARGNDHQRERGRGAPLDALEDRQREGPGLPGAGLRLSEQVAARAQVRDRELLDRSEGVPAEPACGSVELRSEGDQGEDPSAGPKKRAALGGPAHVSSGCPNVLHKA